MKTAIILVPASEIVDWNTFHDVFARTLGFPGFYGRNMDAWIDCMTGLDDPESQMTSVTVDEGGIVVLWIEDAAGFKARCPEQFDTLVECSAFVNWRRTGLLPVLALMLVGAFPVPERALATGTRS